MGQGETMLYYTKHKQARSDRFGVWMIQKASTLDKVRERTVVDFKSLYSSVLSPEYKYPKWIDYQIIDLDGVLTEVISKKGEKQKYALIQLHGGAYVLDFNDTYRLVAKKYLETHKNLAVYSLRYSMAPRHPFPAALEEAIDLYHYLIKHGYDSEHIMIAGDSAGGGLAIAMTLYLRDHNIAMPKALITMSPWTNLAMNGESHEKNKYVDPLFGEGTKPLNVRAYVKNNDVTNPYISPKYGSFDVFTNMLMFVGGHELIWSDTMDIANKAKETNEVYVHDFEGMFHVFPLAFNKIKSSRTAWRLIKSYIQDMFRG